MLFNTFSYWIFFFVTLVLFYWVPFRLGKWLLFFASCLFYMFWNPIFILLLVGVVILNFVAGILIEQADGKARLYWLLMSLTANLGLLALFKYYNFFAALVATALGRSETDFAVNIILPLGMSFHSFQCLAYAIDIYRRKIRATRKILDFALFVTFFPQVVAGPIVRAETFFPELENWAPPSEEFVQRGVSLIFVGLLKKVVFADHLAPIADAYFGHTALYPGMAESWAGVIAFALQIFFDFSGYTDIARGCAYLLGWEFPLNFARPYLSNNLSEFWRRWHISLSTWLRDYLYIPLGGSRHGVLKTYCNLFITMMLGGLWHGASWNFLVWGAFHGVALIFHRALLRFFSILGIERSIGAPGMYPIRVVCTFATVCIGWVFFRASNLPEAIRVLGNLSRLQSSTGPALWTTGATVMLVFSLVVALLEEHFDLVGQFNGSRQWVKVSVFTAILILLQVFSHGKKVVPFIYFQF